MKVIITIKVEKDNSYWDETAVEKTISLESDNDDVLLKAVCGAILGMGNIADEAITERRQLADEEAKEKTDEIDN